MAEIIHVVTRAYDYEGSTAMVAFRQEADAQAFRRLCTEYQARKPRFPENYEDDGVYQAYDDAYRKWRDEHPGGEYAESADSFHVEAIELK